MKFKLLAVAALSLSTMIASGCAPLLIGGAVGALGAHVISRDTIGGQTDKDFDVVWNAAKAVAKTKGVITEEDRVAGYLKVEIDSGYAIIKISRITKSTVDLKVSARKHTLPNLDLAQDIFVRILEEASVDN